MHSLTRIQDSGGYRYTLADGALLADPLRDAESAGRGVAFA